MLIAGPLSQTNSVTEKMHKGCLLFCIVLYTHLVSCKPTIIHHYHNSDQIHPDLAADLQRYPSTRAKSPDLIDADDVLAWAYGTVPSMEALDSEQWPHESHGSDIAQEGIESPSIISQWHAYMQESAHETPSPLQVSAPDHQHFLYDCSTEVQASPSIPDDTPYGLPKHERSLHPLFIDLDPDDTAPVQPIPLRQMLDDNETELYEEQIDLRRQVAIDTLEAKKEILRQWHLLPIEDATDPNVLAEAAENMGSSYTVTTIMVRIMADHEYSQDFINAFKYRRYLIAKSKSDVIKLKLRQSRFAPQTIALTNKLIFLMKKLGVPFDGPIVDLELRTRDIHRELWPYGPKQSYNAILYYLVQNRPPQDAALFRRLRADHKREQADHKREQKR